MWQSIAKIVEHTGEIVLGIIIAAVTILLAAAIIDYIAGRWRK
jgi:flagellar biosynthesis protein FlhB